MKKLMVTTAALIVLSASAHAQNRPSVVNQTTTTQTLITNGTGVFGRHSTEAGEYADVVRIKEGRIDVGAIKATDDSADRLHYRGFDAGGTTIDAGTVSTLVVQTNGGVMRNGTSIEGNDISTTSLSLGGSSGLSVKANHIATGAEGQDDFVSLASTGYVEQKINDNLTSGEVDAHFRSLKVGERAVVIVSADNAEDGQDRVTTDGKGDSGRLHLGGRASSNQPDVSVQVDGDLYLNDGSKAASQNYVNNMSKELSGGVAGVAAMVSIPQAVGVGDTLVGIGLGHFNGQSAVAFGVSHAFNENMTANFSMSHTTASPPVFGAGIGWTF